MSGKFNLPCIFVWLQYSTHSLLQLPTPTVYLWVLTYNTNPIGFYNHLGTRQSRSETLSLVGNQGKSAYDVVTT